MRVQSQRSSCASQPTAPDPHPASPLPVVPLPLQPRRWESKRSLREKCCGNPHPPSLHHGQLARAATSVKNGNGTGPFEPAIARRPWEGVTPREIKRARNRTCPVPSSDSSRRGDHFRLSSSGATITVPHSGQRSLLARRSYPHLGQRPRRWRRRSRRNRRNQRARIGRGGNNKA